MMARREAQHPDAPWYQHHPPGERCHDERNPSPPVSGNSPPGSHRGGDEEQEGDDRRADGGVEASLYSEDRRERSIPSSDILLELIQLRERIQRGEERTEGQEHEPSRGVDGDPGGRPSRIGGDGPEPPHVDHPIGTRDRLETKWRHRIENGEEEASGVSESEPDRQTERGDLTGAHQSETEPGEASRRGGRAPGKGHGTLIAVERAIEGERAPIYADRPQPHARGPRAGGAPRPRRRPAPRPG